MTSCEKALFDNSLSGKHTGIIILLSHFMFLVPTNREDFFQSVLYAIFGRSVS